MPSSPPENCSSGSPFLSLVYHHVGTAQPGAYPDLTVSPEEFESQIRWLAAHGYTSVKMADIARWFDTGTGLPEKPIVITFDDAYADLARYALPVLRRFGFSAVVFVVTARIGQRSVWDESRGYPSLPLMSAEQLQYWAHDRIEFGSHSRTHPDLTKIPADPIFDEIVTSRDELSALLNRPVSTFAFPFGAHNEEVQSIVRSHYDLAFSFVGGFSYLSTDRHLLRRVVVKPNRPMLAFALMIRLGDNFRSKIQLRTRIKRRFGIRASAR